MSVIRMAEKEHVSEVIDEYHPVNSEEDCIEITEEDDVFISQETETTELEYTHCNAPILDEDQLLNPKRIQIWK